MFKLSLSLKFNIRFFDQLGKIFSFVVNDLNDKFHKIEKVMSKNTNNNYYLTVHSAIEYEKNTNIYMNEKNVTLSLLRLIRGLDFLRKFITSLYENKDNAKKSREIAWEVYEQTLAFRHKTIVKNLVKTGVHLLPKKHELLTKLAIGAETNNIDSLFKEFFGTLEKAYMILHKLYSDNNFLELVLA